MLCMWKSPFNIPSEEGWLILSISSFSASAVHVLAVICIVTGLTLALVFYLHAQQRRFLYLADRPTTLGVVGALMSKSHVSELLNPQDTNKEIERKLSGMRFGIDRETGGIERVGRDEA